MHMHRGGHHRHAVVLPLASSPLSMWWGGDHQGGKRPCGVVAAEEEQAHFLWVEDTTKLSFDGEVPYHVDERRLDFYAWQEHLAVALVDGQRPPALGQQVERVTFEEYPNLYVLFARGAVGPPAAGPLSYGPLGSGAPRAQPRWRWR